MSNHESVLWIVSVRLESGNCRHRVFRTRKAARAYANQQRNKMIAEIKRSPDPRAGRTVIGPVRALWGPDNVGGAT